MLVQSLIARMAQLGVLLSQHAPQLLGGDDGVPAELAAMLLQAAQHVLAIECMLQGNVQGRPGNIVEGSRGPLRPM